MGTAHEPNTSLKVSRARLFKHCQEERFYEHCIKQTKHSVGVYRNADSARRAFWLREPEHTAPTECRFDSPPLAAIGT
jgi:hypothetical protein